MGGATSVMPADIRDAFSQQAPDTTQWADTIDWTVRCDWLLAYVSARFTNAEALMKCSAS